jgi:hypothetical protein
MLQAAKQETGISGILCTVNSVNRFNSEDGNLLLALPAERLDRDNSMLLELQIAKLDAPTIRKIQQLLRTSQEQRSN